MSINLNILKCSAEGFSDLSDSDNLVAGCIKGFSDLSDSDKLVAGFIKTRRRFL